MQPGEIMRDSWALYRAHARHLISIAAIVYVPLGVVTAVLVMLGWPGVILANLLNLAAIFLVQGALVKAVEDVSDGRCDLGVMHTFGFAGQRLVPLIVAGILAAAGILVGLALLIVPGLVLLTWWLVVSPVIVLESRSVIDGFGRSRALVRGNSWPVFGVAVMTLVDRVRLRPGARGRAPAARGDPARVPRPRSWATAWRPRSRPSPGR